MAMNGASAMKAARRSVWYIETVSEGGVKSASGEGILSVLAECFMSWR